MIEASWLGYLLTYLFRLIRALYNNILEIFYDLIQSFFSSSLLPAGGPSSDAQRGRWIARFKTRCIVRVIQSSDSCCDDKTLLNPFP